MKPHTTAAGNSPQRRRDAEISAEEHERELRVSLLPQRSLLPQSRRKASPYQPVPVASFSLPSMSFSASSSASPLLRGELTLATLLTLSLLLPSCHKKEAAEVEAPA